MVPGSKKRCINIRKDNNLISLYFLLSKNEQSKGSGIRKNGFNLGSTIYLMCDPLLYNKKFVSLGPWFLEENL